METGLIAAKAAADAYRLGVAAPGSAEQVARATLRACGASVDVLVGRLSDLGFPFVRGRLPRASPKLIHAVSEILGERPPRILELFWEEVGGIELADFVDYGHVQYFERRAIRPVKATVDPVVVDAPSNDWLESIAEQFESFQDELAEAEACAPDEATGMRFLIPLAPDRFHKDDISGGGPYGLHVGDDPWCPVFTGGFEWAGASKPTLASAEPDFVSYLRAAILECGGFPGLLGVAEFEPMRRLLTDGLPSF